MLKYSQKNLHKSEMFLFLQKIFHEMSRWVIYDKSGGVRAVSDGLGAAGNWTLPELEYSGEWMGETFVTLNVRCAVPIEFEIGDYVVYRGEKFVMNYDPTVVKKARRGSYGEGFVYDNVKFNSLGYELTVARMLDYVLYGNDVHYSSLPKFSFFCTDVEDLADRLQVNMNRYCADNRFAVEDYWLFLTPSRDATVLRAQSYGLSERVARDRWAAASFSIVGAKVNQNVSIDNMSVWDSLKFIKDTFGLNFVVRGRSVVVGSAGLPTEDIFEYGKDKGLYEIERTADSEQQIVTKLFSYGSGKNLPVRYYANLNAEYFMTVADIEYNGNDGTNDNYLLALDGEADERSMFKVKQSISGSSGFLAATSVQVDGVGSAISVNVAYDTNRAVHFSVPCSYFQNTLSRGTKLYFTSNIDGDKWPAANKEYSGGASALPNNMAVQVLMLPGFPSQSLYDWVLAHGGTAVADTHATNEFARARWTDDEGEVYDAFFSKVALKPFVISPNFIVLGIREATKYFDGSDGEDEVFPTIEGIPGKNIVLHSDVIEDNGVFGEDVESIANFNIYLPDFGSDFDLAALLQGDTAIEMKSGYCEGRAFKVHSVERVGSGVNMRWKCNCEREPDSDLSIYFPYSRNASIGQTPIANEAYQVRGSDIQDYEGDRYVLTGIEMTSTYVDAASVRLLKYTLRFLAKNDYTRYTFVPKVDEIFMARQHDLAVASRETEQVVKSYYETLKEGDILLFRDTDLGISYETSGSDASVFIDTLRIKEYGNGQIPTYDVTLRDDKQVGTIQRLQEKVSSLSSSLSGGGGGGTNIPQVQSLIKTYGKELFLSKVSDDSASGVISFLKGALFGEGSAWGYVKQVAGEVRSWFKNLATDILTVTGHVKGNNGTLNVYDNIYSTGSGEFDGDLNVVDGSVNADKIIANDGKFAGTITTKNLTVTGLAHFFELVIDKIRSAGGAQIFSPAEGFKVEAVNRFVHQGMVRRRLWWRASDGGTTTSNMWRQGDQAICKNFNDIFQPGSYQEAGNKSYWAVVAWTGTTSANSTPTWDATNPAYVADAPNPYEVTKWHYIDIYADDEGMPIPVDADGKPLWEGAPWAAAAGDDVAQLGYRGTDDVKRGNALYICAYKSLDDDLEAPLIAYYEGINDFDLKSHRTTYKDATSGVWYGTMNVIVGGVSTDIVDYISSQLELTENHFMTQISSLPISRNLLLNTEFSALSGGGVRAMHVTSVGGGLWLQYTESRKMLPHNNYFMLSFFGRGSGSLVCSYGVYKEGRTSAVRSGSTTLTLSSSTQRQYVRFNTNTTGTLVDEDGYTFIIKFSTTGGGEFYLSRPQLEVIGSATRPTTWSNGSPNILLNSAFSEIENDAPKYWEYKGSPSARELSIEVPPYWNDWMLWDTTTCPDVLSVVDGVLRLNPTAQYQGITQYSNVGSAGRWEKVLKHGGTYTVSFKAKGADSTNMVSFILHVLKIGDDGQPIAVPAGQGRSQIGANFPIDNTWKSYSFTFTISPTGIWNLTEEQTDLAGYGFFFMIGCAHGTQVSSEVLDIKEIQFEAGGVATSWQPASYDAVYRATQIQQTADEISLAVKVDGVNRAGVTLNENGVTIDGDKLHFNGTINDEVTIEGANLHILNDIDLQGLTTENVTPVERNPYIPTVINMGIGASSQSEVIKSVQVSGVAGGLGADTNNHIVVLPFYDASDDWTDSYEGITLNDDDTFNLYGNKKVVQWKKSGTRLSIINSVIFKYRNWQNINTASHADSLAGLVVVCSDGRVICKENLRTGVMYNPSTDADASISPHPQLHAGLFSCGGCIARFIVLLPGQTLQLRSQIVSINSRDVLIWVVENPSEFVPYEDSGFNANIQFIPSPGGDSDTLNYISNFAGFNPTDDYHGSQETVMVPSVMNLRSAKSILFQQIYNNV